MNQPEAIENLDERGPEEAGCPQVSRAPLWSRILRYALAVGVLVGLAEVCWTYRLGDMNPDWRSSLPGTFGGLTGFALVAIVTDVIVMLLAGILWGVLLAIWRDLTSSGRADRDRRFAAAWLLLWTGLAFLWVGWMGLFVFVPTDLGTTRFRVTLGAGLAALMGISAGIIWGLNRLRRMHPRLPTICWAVAVVMLFLLTLPAFSRHGTRDLGDVEIPVAAEGPRPHVLLVTLDTVRYDAVACNEVARWIQTPYVDALAADGLRFEQAIAQSPTTTPSHCSIMTSTYPNTHDALNGKPMHPHLPTLAECLRENGYETVAFTSSTTTRSLNSGLDRGFDRYVDSLVPWAEVFSRDEFQNLIAFYLAGVAVHSQIRGDVVTRRALRWLEGRGDGPFFCWLHYFDPHNPYDPPGTYAEMYLDYVHADTPMRRERELYAGEVTYADAQVGEIVEALKKRGEYDDTLIIITSDHGEGFGEKHWSYTEYAHGDNLYDTTQRVPLIIKPASSLGTVRGSRVREQVELIDLAPTVLEVLGIPQPETFAGRSLGRMLAGDLRPGPERPAYALTWVEAYDPKKPQTTKAFVRKLALRTLRWKYVVVDQFFQEELYDLAADPREITNVEDQHPELCAEFLKQVQTVLHDERDSRDDPRARLAPVLRRQLESLGYLGGTPAPESDGSDDDQ